MANPDMNMVALTGRLIKEGDLRYGQNGNAILRFSIAVNRVRRGADGSRTEETSFIDCVYFGKAAESVNQYLDKGRQVAISGELRQNRWEQDGQTRSKLEVFVNSITLLGGGQGRGQGDFQPQSQGGYQRSQGSYQGGQSNYQGQSYGTRAGQSGNSGSAPRTVSPKSVPEDIPGGPESFDDDVIPF